MVFLVSANNVLSPWLATLSKTKDKVSEVFNNIFMGPMVETVFHVLPLILLVMGFPGRHIK